MVETYICLGVFAEAVAALMVRYTWHLHTPIVGLFVRLLPVLVQPFVHYNCLAIGVGGAPAWNRLQAIKYMTYQKIKLGILNLKRNQ
jgi:Na+/H+-dicarboxylate symporter